MIFEEEGSLMIIYEVRHRKEAYK
ncbi:MAG: hypothetical protein HQK89_04930 [Nitrospirae bacterium]|nr:hypothetical protein [Nitrospirota bacterium]